MKQLLFLLLFPCLCMAQYTGNAGQKITLGEQTTADGLVWRGVLNDTALITPFSDTSAYIILDTVNNRFYNYKRNTNVWTQLNILPTDTASMLGNYWRSGNFSGVLPVANGGTGASVKTFVDTINTQTVNGAKTFTGITKITNTTNSTSTTTGALTISGGLGINNTVYGKNAFFEGVFTATGPATGTAFFLKKTGNIDVFAININDNDTWTMFDNFGSGSSYNEGITQKNGNLGIKTQDPTDALHVVGNARITAVGAGAYANDLNITSTGVLTTATSDEKYKYNILPITYGLNTILQLNPVNFQWIKGEENDLGFIAQDVAEIIPEAVNTNWNSDLLMRYESIIPILTKAIQEQQALIKALEQRILILENK